MDRKRIVKFFINGFHSARDRGIFNRADMRPRVKRFARKGNFSPQKFALSGRKGGEGCVREGKDFKFKSCLTILTISYRKTV